MSEIVDMNDLKGEKQRGYRVEINDSVYEIESDLHTHTRYSHGRGSIEDNVKAAISKGLKQIGIAEHGPGHIAFGVSRRRLADMKAEIMRLRDKYPQIEILFGSEANIYGPEGNIDIRREEYDYFDYVCAGWHFGAVDGATPAGIIRTFGNLFRGTVEKAKDGQLRRNTNMIVKAIETGGIKFLTHPGDKAPVDMLEVAETCARMGTLLEINTSHMSVTKDVLRLVMPTGVRFIVNSDAHSPKRVGDFQAGGELIIEAGLDPERVVNMKKVTSDG